MAVLDAIDSMDASDLIPWVTLDKCLLDVERTFSKRPRLAAIESMASTWRLERRN